ncbi:hypothetical protein Y032_0025g1201 [Ancylostoma ceylanicum]|uniref:Uncharacterized protein n=1 Tax=Ancylostoma ceylanicum TaxID=53326 RepID=A0A016UUQ0_9BILA|nr:hypothetical protein Y032_0025g1201 [Ancylostoma ceylanicum]
MEVTRLQPQKARGATAPLTVESSLQRRIWKNSCFDVPERTPARAARSRRALREVADGSPPLTPTFPLRAVFGCRRYSLTHSSPYTLRHVGNGRSLEHAFVLDRLNTRSNVSHYACQPVDHIVANVFIIFRKILAVEPKPIALCTLAEVK